MVCLAWTKGARIANPPPEKDSFKIALPGKGRPPAYIDQNLYSRLI